MADLIQYNSGEGGKNPEQFKNAAKWVILRGYCTSYPKKLQN